MTVTSPSAEIPEPPESFEDAIRRIAKEAGPVAESFAEQLLKAKPAAEIPEPEIEAIIDEASRRGWTYDESHSDAMYLSRLATALLQERAALRRRAEEAEAFVEAVSAMSCYEGGLSDRCACLVCDAKRSVAIRAAREEAR